MYKKKIPTSKTALFPMLIHSNLIAIPDISPKQLAELLAISQGRPREDFEIFPKAMGGYNIIWLEREGLSFPETRWLEERIPSIVVNARRIVSMTEPVGLGWILAAVNSTSDVVTWSLFRDLLGVLMEKKYPYSSVGFTFMLERLSPNIIPQLFAVDVTYPSGTVKFAHYELSGDGQSKRDFLFETITKAEIVNIGALIENVPILVNRQGRLIIARSTVELEILPYLIWRTFKDLGGIIVGSSSM
jgi:hypothetical protein